MRHASRPSPSLTQRHGSLAISWKSRGRRPTCWRRRKSLSASRSWARSCSIVGDLAKDYRARGGDGSRKGWLRAVEGVSFEIKSGESLGLVGESGSGKSTVARLLLGLTERTRGEVAFDGRPLEARGGGLAAEQRGRVQMVFQDPGDSLDPLMSIDKIVAEPLMLLDRRERGRTAVVFPNCSTSLA